MGRLKKLNLSPGSVELEIQRIRQEHKIPQGGFKDIEDFINWMKPDFLQYKKISDEIEKLIKGLNNLTPTFERLKKSSRLKDLLVDIVLFEKSSDFVEVLSPGTALDFGSNEVVGVTVVDFTKVLECYSQFIGYVKSLDLPLQLPTGIEEISLSYKTRQ